MGLFSKSTQTKPPVGVVIIGSANIVGAIVSFDHDQSGKKLLPRIAHVSSGDITRQEDTSFRDYFLGVLKTLKKILNDLSLGGELRPERFLCFLGSPFYVGQTRINNINQDKPIRVTRKTIHDLILKEAERYGAEQPLLYPEVLNDSNLVFENELMQIKLNGYETSNPYNKLANQIYWSQYVSIGSKVIIDKLREAFNSENNLPVDFHSFTSANFFAFKEVMPDPDSFIVLDVVGQLTDLMVVSGGILIEHSSYPFGVEKLVKRLAEELNVSKAEAQSTLRMYSAGTLDIAATTTTAINIVKNEWLFSLRQGLNHVLETALLPETVLLVGTDEVNGLFATWLRDESLNDFTLSNNKMVTKIIQNDFFTDHCLFAPDTPVDPALLAAAVFCAKI